MSDNYPLGVNGSCDYFNEPDPPECRDCGATLETDWEYCPYCGEKIDWEAMCRD